jgi:hypothetical protein
MFIFVLNKYTFLNCTAHIYDETFQKKEQISRVMITVLYTDNSAKETSHYCMIKTKAIKKTALKNGIRGIGTLALE